MNCAPARKAASVDGLELISYLPRSRAYPAPLLFVHGAFVAAWCWDEFFLPYLAQRGYAVHALSLRGHGGSTGTQMLAFASLDDYESDVLRIAQHIGEPVVAIGHSMGGMVVQRCRSRLNALATVLMAPVPPEGLLGSSLLLAARDPALFHALNGGPGYSGAAGVHGLRRLAFSPRVSEPDAMRYMARMQQESQRALLDLSWPQHLFIRSARDVPMLVMGAADDAIFPVSMIEATAQFHGVAAEIVPDIGHSMMLEPEWKKVADRIASWVAGSTASSG